jgi:tetratricopeptide (TPR) repeat protein
LSSSGTSSASSPSSRRPTSSYSRTAAGTTLGATSLNATSLSAGSEASSRPYSSSLYSQSQRSSSDLSSSEAKDSYSEDSTISSYNTTSESSFQTSASHANDEDTTFEMASYGSSSSGSSSESGKTYEKNYENQSGYIKPKKPVNKKLIAGLACAIAAIGIGGGVGGWLYSTRDVRAARKAERLALEQQRQEKENTIALIQTYSSQGLYDNSLSLINGLLLKDNQDTDGNSLFNTTAQLKKDSDPHAGFSGQTFTDPFGNESYDSSKHSNAISIAQRYVDTALYDDASTVLNALLVDNPEDDEAKQMLDMAMTFRERASEETLKAEAEQAALDRQNALKQANDAVDSGLYDQAIAVLGALAAKDPNDAEVRSLLEKAAFLKEEADKAEAARNARLAKEEAEQAEKERKANEAAANQALKDQLAARASLSNEGNAGQNPPVYSEMANVITPSSGTGSQAAKNTGSSANGTSSDSKHKYSNPNAQSQGARNEGSSLADLVSGTGSQVAKNTGTSTGNTSANSTSGHSEASTPKTVKTVVSNTPSSNTASSGSSAGNASSGTGTSSANRPAASATASSTAVAANTGTSSSSRNAPATNASASSSLSSGTGNASAGNSAANASGAASSSTGTASGSAGKASASTGSPSAANTSASQTRPAVNASTGKSSAKPITVDRSTGNVRTPSSREEALARATELTDEGRYDDALRILNDLMIRNPNDKDALLRMYRAADEKRELLRRNRKGDSSSVPSAEELSQRKKQDQLSLAQKYLDAGDYEKAQQILNELAKTNKGDSQIQNMLNKANAQAKAAEEKAAAQKAAEQQAAQKAAQEKADKLAQAQKALEAGDYDKAQQILNSIPANQRSDSDVNAMRNKIASAKQAADAKAAAEKAAKEKSDKLAQAQKALEAGDYDKAQQILNSIPANQRSDSDVTALRNKIASEKQAAQAKAQAEKAAQEKADKLAQAQKALDAGDYAKAQAILNTLPSSEKRDTDVQALISKAAAQEKEALAKKAAEEERVKKAAEDAAKAKKQAELAALQKDIDSEIAKGKAALAAGNVEEAIAHFNKAMSMLPSDDPAYAAKKKSEIAQALYDASESTDNPADKKKLADAAKTLANEAVAKGSDDAGSHYVLGMEALKNKNYAQAEAEFEKAIKADPKNASYYYQLGRAQAQQGKFKAAQASFKNSTELNPKFAPAFYNLGYVSERLNDNSQALVSYRKAYQIDGEYERAYIAAGRIMARQGDNQGASAAFDKAIKINPANSQTYQEYGSALAAIGNYSAAENSFKKAIAYMDKSKTDPATYYNLSTVLLAQEKNSEALSYAKQSYELKASANDELKNNITYNYALAQEKAGNAEFAKSLYNEVLLNDPNNVKARTNLGALYNEDGQSDSAIAVLSKAYELDSSNFEVNNNLGNAYNKKENFTQAIKYYQNALAISPKDNTVRANLAKAYAGAKQYDSAKVAYEDVIAANPKDWESYLELSKVCIALGDMESAETYLTYLQKNNPTYKMAEVAKLLASIKK